MASPNNPKSAEQLIREHSKARVISADRVHPIDQRLTGLRQLSSADVIESMVRKYR